MYRQQVATPVIGKFRHRAGHLNCSQQLREHAHLCLEPPLEQFLGSELENVVEFLLVLSEETESSHATEESRALKQTLGVLHVQREQLSSSLEDGGRRVRV